MKKVGIVLLVLLVIGGGVLGYYWRQATALPDWYSGSEIEESDEHFDPDAELEWTVVPDQEPSSAVAPTKQAKPKKAVMKGFHLRTRMKNPAARKAFRASRATYEDDHLEAGVVVNLSRIPKGELKKKDRSFFEKVAEEFPTLTKRDVYVALQDEPRVAPDGILQLGPNPEVRVGNLNYSLKKVAKRLGMSERAVRKDLNAELRRMKVRDPAFNPDL